MNRILISLILIVLMGGIASAEQITGWPYGKSNVMPNHIEGVMYDFEDGSNCVEFKNQHPEIATFLTVLGTQPYGTSDWPSYVTVGGSTCGDTRCYMKIYPWCGYYQNGTPFEWVFITNGRSAFSPMTGPDQMGGFWPGTKSHIVFKEDTRYVSFLACTDGNMYVDLYDRHGNRICSEKITTTVYRTGTNPSNFTAFSFYSLNTDIVLMKIRGNFNGHHIDDLIIGGAPGYLPDEPINYSWAAERISLLDGARFNPIGLGYDLVMGEFYTADEIINGRPMNWDPLNKELSFSPGINDVGAIIWALNENKNIVNNLGIDDMADKDFTEWIAYGDQRPGDVAFIDYEADGYYDEVVMFIEPQIDHDTGALEDCIRFLEEPGVHFVDSKYLHALYGVDNGVGVQSFMDVKSLPDSPNGKKNPYPNVPGKYKKLI